jgi:two-component system chemotaxis sensor kinase CheA
MSETDQEFLRKLQAAFQGEAEEHLQVISAGLLELEKQADAERGEEIVASIYREFHSLKGAARAVNASEIEEICQSSETVLSAWKRAATAPAPAQFDPLHDAINMISRMLLVADGKSTEPPRTEITALLSRIAALDGDVQPPPRVPAVAPVESMQRELSKRSSRKPPAPALQPSRPFIPETLRISAGKLDALLLQAEELLTLKLTMAQCATDLRQALADLRKWERDCGNLAPELRSFQDSLKTSAARSPSAERIIEYLDREQAYLHGLTERITALVKSSDHDHRSSAGMIDSLLEDAKKLLMLPLVSLLESFPKLVRDLSRDQGKEVDLLIHGGNIEIDRRILAEMKDPLVHLLRNCVDHGIETPTQRLQGGKPPRAKIELTAAELDGNKVEIVIADDGAGMSPDEIRSAAVRHGVISEEDSRKLEVKDALLLVFRADVSTSPAVTEISGRGLGLAIVKEKVEKLGGTISLDTALGKGTSFRLVLPLTLATFRGILVQVAGQVLVVPTATVARVVRVNREDRKTVENMETIELDGQAMSFVRMAEALGLDGAAQEQEPASMPAVVLGSAENRIAFGVDGILDEQEVLVKPFAKPLVRVRNIAAATILGSGKAVPILNVSDLLKSATRQDLPRPSRAASTEPKASVAAVRKSILVVEDSITARMLVKNILESAGYAVKTAVDGLDAITLLRTEPFDAVVSDVEMPRMDGFDLTARVRADKKLSDLPVVLVTARASQEDREHGAEVGADAYIVKSSFDQSNLLEVVRRLV